VKEDKTSGQATERIREKLRSKYKDDLLLEEFTTPSDSGYNNHADAIAISCHPARSTNIEYFEIKSLRNDWLKELKTPSKSEILTRYCHKIWLITSTQDIARIDEIPDNWGWMFLKNKRLKILKEAPKLEPVFDIGFIIRVAQYSKREFNNEIWSVRNKAYEEAKIDIEKRQNDDYWKSQADIYKNMYETLKSFKKEFQEITGLYISDRDKEGNEILKEIAPLVKALLDLKQAQKKLSSNDFWWHNQIKDIEEQLKIIKNATENIKKIDINIPSLKETKQAHEANP